MQVRFYFDPLCPWCWITSRWLRDVVAPERDIDIDWRPISLFVRNEDNPDLPEQYRAPARTTMNWLRVVEAMRAKGDAALVDALYTELGTRIHVGESLDFDVTEALDAAGVDAAYAAAFDDDSLDDAVRASTQEATDVAGDDVGTPIIAYEVDGEWKGYFGPVIPAVVEGEAGLRLWDGLSMLIETDGFYELKKTRTVGPQIPGKA